MVFKNLCVFVLWTKVGSALEGLNCLVPPYILPITEIVAMMMMTMMKIMKGMMDDDDDDDDYQMMII